MRGITQEILKEILHYQPDTGVFTWLKHGGGNGVGAIAGSEKGDGRIQIQIMRKKYLASRLAYLYIKGRFPDVYIGHKNGDFSDIRWSNLEDTNRKLAFIHCKDMSKADLHKEVTKKRALVLKQKDLGKVPDVVIWKRIKDRVEHLTVSMVSRYRLEAGIQSSTPKNTKRLPPKVNEISQWLLKWGVP